MSDLSGSIVEFYDRSAKRFDAERGRGLIERDWLDRLLALASPGGRVLDIGCGAGEPIAHYILDRGFALTGVDSSPTMIGLSRRRFPNAEFVVADMRNMALGRRFDALIAWDSFFHLSRKAQRAMFATFAAHAAPGAPLMFTCGPAEGDAIGDMFGEPLFHASLVESEYRALLAEHGFDCRHFVREDAACGRHTVCLAQKVGRRGAA